MLSHEHARLIGLVETLSAEQAGKVLAFAQALVGPPEGLPINDSLQWTAEDLEEFARASMDYANKTIPWDDDSYDKDEAP